MLSPLLANIALHGLETTIKSAIPQTHDGKEWTPMVVRYADDFVILHQDLATLERAKDLTEQWLGAMGLELKPSKTRIVHSLSPHNGHPPGFDFLGFLVRQYPVGKTPSGRHASGFRGVRGEPLGFKTRTQPSPTAIRRHQVVLANAIRLYRSSPQEVLIRHLNPIIRGWSAYFATSAAKKIFGRLDFHTYVKLQRWAHRRHPKKAGHWISAKYWRLERGSWTFGTPEGLRLRRHDHTPIRRHIKVRGTKSPFDGDWPYWATRLGRHPELPKRITVLLKWQRGRCAHCGLYVKEGDLLEVDHIVPRAEGGNDTYLNWQLLHRHCHDQKTARDLSRAVARLTTRQTSEEPDEGELSCPVLETSRLGDQPT